MKHIDYLFEDPPVAMQKYALVSIVGPHMPQKCDVWGLKIRGVAETIEKARAITQRLMKIDNNYDIYTVEVGKFFPLAVEPHEISEVEYENKQLNDLVKSYLENRQRANDEWATRKNEMVQEAIREGQQQDKKPEHPVAVLQRIKMMEQQLQEENDKLQELEGSLNKSKELFASYTDAQREEADAELRAAIHQATPSASEEESLADMRKQLMAELSVSNETAEAAEAAEVAGTVKELRECEEELRELQSVPADPKVQKEMSGLEERIAALKTKLQDGKAVNDFINSKYVSSDYDFLTKPSPSNGV